MSYEPFTIIFSDYNYTYTGPPIDPVIISGVLLLLTCIGILANSLVLLIIAQNHAAQKANVYIGALALADLMYLMCCAPFMMYYFYNTVTWDLGQISCKAVSGMAVVLQSAAVFTLVALSANRYHTIVSITPDTSGFCHGNIFAQIAFIWGFSLILGIVGICGSYVERNSCYFMFWDDPMGDLLFALGYFCLFFFIPISIIFFYYSRLACHLFISIERLPDDGYLARNSQILARRRLVYVVLALVVLFIACWLPYHSVEILSAAYRSSLTSNVQIIFYLRMLFSPMAYLKSTLNPFVLFAMSSFFRMKLKHFFRCCSNKPGIRPRRYFSMYSKKVSRTSNGTTRVRLSGAGSPV